MCLRTSDVVVNFFPHKGQIRGSTPTKIKAMRFINHQKYHNLCSHNNDLSTAQKKHTGNHILTCQMMCYNGTKIGCCTHFKKTIKATFGQDLHYVFWEDGPSSESAEWLDSHINGNRKVFLRCGPSCVVSNSTSSSDVSRINDKFLGSYSQHLKTYRQGMSSRALTMPFVQHSWSLNTFMPCSQATQFSPTGYKSYSINLSLLLYMCLRKFQRFPFLTGNFRI